MTNTLEELIKLNHDLRVALLTKWQARTPYIREGKAWPLLYLAVQMANLHEAIELLASKGFGREAGILLRSMFEATVNVKWIALDPENRLDRYAAYRYFAAEQYRDLGERLPSGKEKSPEQRKQYEKESEQIRREARKAKYKYGFRKFDYWSGKSLKKMAEEVGWLPRYESVFKIYSDVTHANIGSSQDFISSSESGTIFIQRKARFPHAEPVMKEAYCYLTNAFAFTDICVELGIEAEIDKAIKNVNAILSGDLRHLESL